MMAYTSINIPYAALMGVISPDSIERTSVSTYRFVAAFCGGIVVQYCTLELVEVFGGGTETILVAGVPTQQIVDEQTGFFWTMATFSIAAVILFLITFATTRERVAPEVVQASTFKADLRFVLTSFKLHQIFLLGVVSLALLATAMSSETPKVMAMYVLVGYILASSLSLAVRLVASLRLPRTEDSSTFENDFNDLIANRPWMVLFAFGLLQLTAAFVRGGSILYYFKYFCGNASTASSFLVAGSFAAITGMLLTKKMVSLFGKKMLMIYMNSVVGILTAAFYFLDPDQIGWMFALHIAASFVGGPSPVCLWAMYADVVDYSEWKTHRRATGLVFSAATFSQKLGCAVGAAMTGFALNFYDYAQPIDGIDQPQSNMTLYGIRMMMSLMPASFLLLAAGCLSLYSINERTIRTLESDLRDRKSEHPMQPLIE